MIDFIERCISNKGKQYYFNSFSWIKNFNYYIDYDKWGEEIVFVEILFGLDNGELIKLRFIGVFNLKLNIPRNQIVGFDIVDNKNKGWSVDCRYHVEDYENGVIDFYCSKIEAIE